MPTKLNSNQTVVVWGQPNCPACVEADRLLFLHGIVAIKKVIGLNGVTKKDLMLAVPNARTVPQITVDGVAIGGLHELKKLLT
jgi:glutaredoxin